MKNKNFPNSEVIDWAIKYKTRSVLCPWRGPTNQPSPCDSTRKNNAPSPYLEASQAIILLVVQAPGFLSCPSCYHPPGHPPPEPKKRERKPIKIERKQKREIWWWLRRISRQKTPKPLLWKFFFISVCVCDVYK